MHARTQIIDRKDFIAFDRVSVSVLKKNIHQAKSYINGLQSTVAKLNFFIQNLAAHPEFHYIQLYQYISKEINVYESTHPANQHVLVRMSLSELERGLTAINQLALSVLSKYRLLAAMLWHVVLQVESKLQEDSSAFEKIDPQFMTLLRSLVFFSRSAKEKKFLNSYRGLRAQDHTFSRHWDESFFNRLELKYYNYAYQDLSRASRLVAFGERRYHPLSSCIEVLKKSISNHLEHGDLKFCTTVLRTLNDSLISPNEVFHFARLAEFASQNKPSISSKMQVLLFLGLLTAGFSLQAIFKLYRLWIVANATDAKSNLLLVKKDAVNSSIAAGVFLSRFGLMSHQAMKTISLPSLSQAISEAANKIIQSKDELNSHVMLEEMRDLAYPHASVGPLNI